MSQSYKDRLTRLDLIPQEFRGEIRDPILRWFISCDFNRYFPSITSHYKMRSKNNRELATRNENFFSLLILNSLDSSSCGRVCLTTLSASKSLFCLSSYWFGCSTLQSSVSVNLPYRSCQHMIGVRHFATSGQHRKQKAVKIQNSSFIAALVIPSPTQNERTFFIQLFYCCFFS